MKQIRYVATTVALCLAVQATAAEESPPAPAERSAQVSYLIYSLDIGDPLMPTRSDAKVKIGLTGKAARDLYAHLAPASAGYCGVEPGTRIRQTPNGKVACVRSPKAEYWCAIAVDLKTGESVVGMVC